MVRSGTEDGPVGATNTSGPSRPQTPAPAPTPTGSTSVLTVLSAIEDKAEREAATWVASQWDVGRSPSTNALADRFGFGYDRANRIRTWLAGELSRLGGRVPPARTKPAATPTRAAEPDLRAVVSASPARMEIKGLLAAILDAGCPARRSIPQLAAAAGMNERTARKHLAALVAAGVVVREDDREFSSPSWRVVPDDLAGRLVAFAKDGRGGFRPGVRA